MSIESSSKASIAAPPQRLTNCILAASIALAAAALTGCNAAPTNQAGGSFPSLLGASHFNGEVVSTLGANYTVPPDPHHHGHVQDIRKISYSRPGHRVL